MEEALAEQPIILDEDLSDVESASDEEIAALLQNENIPADEAKEEKKADPGFNAYYVDKNDLYGSETIMKYANNTSVKTILISIFLGLFVIAAIIILVIILKG